MSCALMSSRSNVLDPYFQLDHVLYIKNTRFNYFSLDIIVRSITEYINGTVSQITERHKDSPGDGANVRDAVRRHGHPAAAGDGPGRRPIPPDHAASRQGAGVRAEPVARAQVLPAPL